MREIKFKYYFKNLKGEIETEIHSLDDINFSECLNSSLNNMALINRVQYTGLKDKNGNEIYEGDIVKCTDEDGTSSTHKIMYHSAYEYPAFDITPSHQDIESNGLSYFGEWGSIEIIGNTYQNTELLEK